MPDLLVYGSYGYTGTLVVARALDAGLDVAIAGRDRWQLERQAAEVRVPACLLALDDPAQLEDALKSARVVLSCAGPFSRTWRPMVEACLRARTHYLDVTGEIAVFEAIAALDGRARQSGVMLLPGVGFDVVPSDCLAAHLQARLPSAKKLTLAVQGDGGLSRGTLRTLVENLGTPGAVRIDGEIRRVPPAWKTRKIDFGDGPSLAVTIPWGDVSTAWYSTGIPNIEVYAAVSKGVRRLLVAARFLAWLARSRPLRDYLRRRVDAGPLGPSADERARSRSRVWGEATDGAGGRAVSRLSGPNAYSLTAELAVAAAALVCEGRVRPGFQTPSRVFGAGFVLEHGMTRTDVS
jgi:short subunit dehydrogenase-like uncharacterized protein